MCPQNSHLTFLYRGLRKDEAEANQLIPKDVESFKDLNLNAPMFAVMTPYATVTMVGQLPDAALGHQLGSRPMGVSTSKNREVARWYATHGSALSGIVVRIKRNVPGITEFDTVLLGPRSPKPLDEEEVLLGESYRGIIDKTFKILPSGEWEEVDVIFG